MNVQEIPLTANNQFFNIALGEISLNLRLVYRDVAGWIMDVRDSGGADMLCGVPLVVGVDLIEQYPELGINGVFAVLSDDSREEYPTKTNLGTGSHLYFVQNS
ncbi:hypothetical protein AB8899_12295 [Yersinia enterocolitica]|uniref:phage baseplate plug family protein n=1 Tax=Yersinia enterocolitica TaxID=630 RepID=UPI000327E361|nr:hypothetical protein [Yersinia enterocolitica]EKN4773944.1 hypothetical protein [Yersinia enterocolitica]CCV60945.1 putative bacteriophage protein [Yersinia enterocolitica (type O:2) str. YE3094/96]CNE05671.1 Uncharacterised protein [Yersinia enterocolitica]HDL6968795.1 hypothetical protein [Yersinia enterocolitica]HDL6977128.1 hypothetical protein [Yersinia enterocolitica]